MTVPIPFPDWLPWWVPFVVLVPVIVYLAFFLVMPFSVFGLKPRLNNIEARLDEIQGELRRIGARVPGSVHYAGSETPPAFGRGSQPAGAAPRPAAADEQPEDRTPPRFDAPPPLRADPLAPPRRHGVDDEDPPRRVEPRLDWSRE